MIPGALYNFIRVPPEKKDATDTLQGAKILCSIAPANKSHPSYYHSFGKSAFISDAFMPRTIAALSYKP